MSKYVDNGKGSKVSNEAWKRARIEYEHGNLSVDLIAEKYGISRTTFFRRAKEQGWVRNKNKEIAELAADKIAHDIQDEILTVYTKEDVDLYVENSADIIASVNRIHRNTIMRLRQKAAYFVEELDKNKDGMSLKDRVVTFEKLVSATEKLIAVERRSLGMDGWDNSDIREESGRTITVNFVSADGTVFKPSVLSDATEQE